MLQVIPTQAKSIFDITKILESSEHVAIVRPANPPQGIAGYVFDIIGDESVDLTSEITDHYVEDNTAIQDHIALAPETISVSGVVAELVFAKPTETQVDKPADIDAIIEDYEPEFTVGGDQAIASVEDGAKANAVAKSFGQSLNSKYASFAPEIIGGRQSRAFGYFYQLWKGRALFTVETPWGVFNSMAIESITTSQSGDTRMVSDFTIKFKRIRFAQTVVVNVGELAGRAAASRAPIDEKGKATSAPAKPRSVSLFKQLITYLNN